jgi:hypothetical protein
MDTKASNPKDLVGSGKVPLWLLSPVAKVKWAVAQFAGLCKYGAWNWRAAGVRTSTYLSAIERHLEKYKAGEQLDQADRTHHLANIMACCAILLEAEHTGMLTDDRPPANVDVEDLMDEALETMAFLREKYKDQTPRHWNINDTAEINLSVEKAKANV